MVLNSFRARIALLSALLAGGALVSFSIVSLWLIDQTKLKRIDDGIKDQLMRESDRPRPQSHWQTYTDSLLTTFSTNRSDDLALLVQTPEGQTIYRSLGWSTELNRTTSFPPRLHQDSLGTTPGRFPPPFPPPFPLPNPRFPPESSQLPPLGQGAPLDNRLDAQLDDQPGPPPAPPEEAPGRLRQLGRLAKLRTETTPTGSWRVGAVMASDVRIAIAVNLRTIEADMNGIRNAYLVSIPLLLVWIALGAWWLSGRALKPIREITHTLRRVTAKGLDQRVSVGDSDREFVELLQVFNQMMERLERSFTQASRFSADAAHELKTPLAVLQGELERTLQAAKPGSELQQRLSQLLDEVRHLGAIVRKLLLLSLADAGQMRLHQLEVDLSKLLTDLVDDIDMLAPDLKVQVQVDSSLSVKADQALLIQVLQNLISNATKYNLPGGWIRIVANQRDRYIFVTVSNSSKDIPAQERSRIFERFHRGDPSHTHQIEGLGLGLSLSREIAYAHGGNLTLDPSPKRQTVFTLTLPAA